MNFVTTTGKQRPATPSLAWDSTAEVSEEAIVQPPDVASTGAWHGAAAGRDRAVFLNADGQLVRVWAESCGGMKACLTQLGHDFLPGPIVDIVPHDSRTVPFFVVIQRKRLSLLNSFDGTLRSLMLLDDASVLLQPPLVTLTGTPGPEGRVCRVRAVVRQGSSIGLHTFEFRTGEVLSSQRGVSHQKSSICLGDSRDVGLVVGPWESADQSVSVLVGRGKDQLDVYAIGPGRDFTEAIFKASPLRNLEWKSNTGYNLAVPKEWSPNHVRAVGADTELLAWGYHAEDQVRGHWRLLHVSLLGRAAMGYVKTVGPVPIQAQPHPVCLLGRRLLVGGLVLSSDGSSSAPEQNDWGTRIDCYNHLRHTPTGSETVFGVDVQGHLKRIVPEKREATGGALSTAGGKSYLSGRVLGPPVFSDFGLLILWAEGTSLRVLRITYPAAEHLNP